jgi:tetratricopeptide (TPR) repeat protein
MARADAQKLLDEARGLFDELIKSSQELHGALLAKALAIETQAKRVEPDPKRQAALMEESERVAEQAFKMRRDERRAGMSPEERLEEDYSQLFGQAIELQTAGRHQEALALHEKFLAANPRFGRAHEGVANAHSSLAGELRTRGAGAAAERMRHLEQARTHYQHAVDLASDGKDPPMAALSLLHLLGPEELNRPPAEREALARAMIKRFPGDQLLLFQLLRIVIDGGRWGEVDGVLQTARAAIPMTPERRQAMGAELHDIVFRNARLPADTTKTLVAEGIARLDEALKLKPDFIEALVYKSLVLRLQAERVEKDPARAKALVAEADKLRARAEALRKNSPG